MKKTIAILLILLSLGTVAFAKGGLTLKGGFTYDFVNLKSAESEDVGGRQNNVFWRANAFGAEVGLTYNLSDKLIIYCDSALGFYNKLTIGKVELKKDFYDKMSFLATSEHFGTARIVNLGKGLDLQVGGGFAFEYARLNASYEYADTTTIVELGIFAVGVGFFGNLDYSISDKLALSFTVHPDIMFVSGDHFNTYDTFVYGSTVINDGVSMTTFGGVVSFKFNATLGLSYKI